MDTLLRDIFIRQSQIDRYYENHVPVHLWRALNRKKNVSLFDLIEKPYIPANGRPRPADITIVDRGGTAWVTVASRPRGISTFNAPSIPKGNDWIYYRIPAGTVLPQGLAIVRDEYNHLFGATHYTIAPARDMPLSHFKFLLNTLAASAIKEVG